MGIYYFFSIFSTDTDEQYTNDDRVDTIIWTEYLPIWAKVWATCFILSGVAFVFAARMNNLGV